MELASQMTEISLGGSHSGAVRVGQTVRRASHPWSAAVFDLLGHLEREGFAGAPRALGFDDQGREVLTYIEGEAGLSDGVWPDHVLVHLGALIRRYHDAAATFAWAGREWMFEPRQPVETICHNELFPWNTVFLSGVPVAFIDWDTASPGPRAWDLGLAAWRWVPFSPDEKDRAIGLPSGVAEKARRFRLLLDAYGTEPDIGIVAAGIERMQGFLDHMSGLAAEGSEWEAELARRGVLKELAREIAWVKEHAAALAES